jgi:hypothetical protein
MYKEMSGILFNMVVDTKRIIKRPRRRRGTRGC